MGFVDRKNSVTLIRRWPKRRFCSAALPSRWARYQTPGTPANADEVGEGRGRGANLNLPIIGTGYSCLQDYLPHVAQAVVRAGWADFVGLGRMGRGMAGRLLAAGHELSVFNRTAEKALPLVQRVPEYPFRDLVDHAGGLGHGREPRGVTGRGGDEERLARRVSLLALEDEPARMAGARGPDLQGIIYRPWARFGEQLGRFLTRHFRVRVLMESACEGWFGDAAVNPVVMIISDNDTKLSGRITNFSDLSCVKLMDVASPSLATALNPVIGYARAAEIVACPPGPIPPGPSTDIIRPPVIVLAPARRRSSNGCWRTTARSGGRCRCAPALDSGRG